MSRPIVASTCLVLLLVAQLAVEKGEAERIGGAANDKRDAARRPERGGVGVQKLRYDEDGATKSAVSSNYGDLGDPDVEPATRHRVRHRHDRVPKQLERWV